LRPGHAGLAGGGLAPQARGIQRHAGLGDVIAGNGPGGQLPFEQPHNVALRQFLPREQ
jgi:hypothetical protein